MSVYLSTDKGQPLYVNSPLICLSVCHFDFGQVDFRIHLTNGFVGGGGGVGRECEKQGSFYSREGLAVHCKTIIMSYN